MLLYIRVFYEFFKIGLFAVGGGPATLPYLIELSDRYGWYTLEELTNMIAISQSTPGPLGLNMATYAGFHTLGITGGITATLGLVTPSIIVICLIAAFFSRVNKNYYVQTAFKYMRPCVTGIIAAAVAGICRVTLFYQFDIKTLSIKPVWQSAVFTLIVLSILQIKKLKKIHPFFYFVMGAVTGIVLRF